MKNNTPYAQRFDSAPLGLNRLNPPAVSSDRTAGLLSYTFDSPAAQGKFVAALDDEDIRFVTTYFAGKHSSEAAAAQYMNRWRNS